MAVHEWKNKYIFISSFRHSWEKAVWLGKTITATHTSIAHCLQCFTQDVVTKLTSDVHAYVKISSHKICH